MTYSALLTAIYADYDKLWDAWTAEMERAEDIGMFVFIPEGYKRADALGQASYSYWTTERARAYVEEMGLSLEGFEELVNDIVVAEEFLVMIVEEGGGLRRKSVHVHRVGRLGVN